MKGVVQMKLEEAEKAAGVQVCKGHPRGWVLVSSQGGQPKHGLIRVRAAILAYIGRASVLGKPI